MVTTGRGLWPVGGNFWWVQLYRLNVGRYCGLTILSLVEYFKMCQKCLCKVLPDRVSDFNFKTSETYVQK